MKEESNQVKTSSSVAAVTELDLLVSNVLRYGLIAATFVMVAGAALTFADNSTPSLALRHFHSEPNDLRNIAAIVRLALAGNGPGMMQAAILLLLLTPLLRVAFCLYGFTRQRDWKFVLVSLIVLSLLIYGIFFGADLG